MRRLTFSRKRKGSNFVAIFLLAFASVATFFFAYDGWSFAEDGTVPQKFEIKWTSPTDGEYLTYDNTGMAILKPKKENCDGPYGTEREGCLLKMNVGFIAGGADAYPADTITLKIPKYIVHDRDGKSQGSWTVGLSKDKVGSTGFYYDDTSDQDYLIVKNFEEVSPTREISFDVTYRINKDYEYVSNIVDEARHDVTAIVNIRGESEDVIVAESNTIHVTVDTFLSLGSVTKKVRENGGKKQILYNWNPDWDRNIGDKKPDNPEDFVYIVWEIYFLVSGTQYKYITIEDNPSDNLELVGFLSSSRYEKVMTSYQGTWYSANDYVVTMFPKDAINETGGTTINNTAKVIVDGIDNTHEEKEVEASVSIPRNTFRPSTTYKDKISKDMQHCTGSWDCYYDKYALEKLKNSQPSIYEETSAFWGTATVNGYGLTRDSEDDDIEPSSFGHKEYKMEFTDDCISIDGERLVEGDYEIPSYVVLTSEEAYEDGLYGWNTASVSTPTAVIAYYRDTSGWHKHGTWETIDNKTIFHPEIGDSQSFAISSFGSDKYGPSTYGKGAILPSGTIAIRLEGSTKNYSKKIQFAAGLNLFPTKHILSILDGKGSAHIQNIDTLRVFDSDNEWVNKAKQSAMFCYSDNDLCYSESFTGSRGIAVERDEELYGEGNYAKHDGAQKWIAKLRRDATVRKRAYKRNEPENARVKIEYGMVSYGYSSDPRTSCELDVYNDWQEGIYYDLLPLGAKLDESSLLMGPVDTESNYFDTTSWHQISTRSRGSEFYKDFDLDIIENYRGSGRTMIIIKRNLSNEETICPVAQYGGYSMGGDYQGWALSYDVYYSYESIVDYGTTLVNSAGFQYGGDGDLGYDNDGGRLIDQELMSGLGDNPTQDTLYAEVTTVIDDPINAELSSTKKVMAKKDVNYTMETETEQDDIYKYRLRTATAEGSSASNIIVYDVLEKADPENTNRWDGTFDSVDVTQPKLKGADPVVYYSTKKDIKLCEDTNFCPDNDLDNGLVWTNRLDDIENKKDVTAIAVDMRKKEDGTNFSIGEKEAVSVIINMRAPKGGIVKKYMETDALALNESWFSNTLSQNDGSNVSGMTKSQVTKVHIKVPDLDIDKSSDPETGTAEERASLLNNTTLDYTINLRNKDDTAYTNVEIEDTIPAGLTILPEQIRLASGEVISAEDSAAAGETEETEETNVVYRIDPDNPQRLIFTIKNLAELETVSIVIPTTLPKFVDKDITYDNTPQINSIDGEEYLVKGNTTYHEKKTHTLSTNIATILDGQEQRAGENGLEVPADQAKGVTLKDYVAIENLPVGDYKLVTKLINTTDSDREVATVPTNFSVVDSEGENKLSQDGSLVDEIVATLTDLDLAPRSVYVAYTYLYDTSDASEKLIKAYEDKTDKLETVIVGNTSHDLMITKTITGDGAQATDEFSFSVELKGLTKNNTYTAITSAGTSYTISADKDGKATLYNVALKGGETLTIKDLDTLAYYKVQEASSTYFSSYAQTGSEENANFTQKADSNSKRYRALATKEEQILDENGDVSISFTNHKLAYKIATQVSMGEDKAGEDGLKLSSEDAKLAKLIDTVTINNLVKGDYQLVTGLYNKTTAELEDNLLTTDFSVNEDDELVQNGVVVEKLSIELSEMNLAPRTTYVIYEAIYANGSLVLAHHEAEDTLQTVIVDNSHYDLTLSKTISGTGANAEDKFAFTLSFKGLSPEASYQTDMGELTANEAGEASMEVEIKGGEEFNVKGLDTLSYYTIEEAESDYIASYEQSATLGTANFAKPANAQDKAKLALATEAEQILDENGNVTVAFTNHKDKDPDPEPEKPIVVKPQENPKTESRKVSTLFIMLGSCVVLMGAMAGLKNRRRE